MDRRVLLVDDDPNVIGVLQAAFRSEGFSVDVAATGREALSHVAEGPPDIIVLDVGLPDILGTEVARRLRSDGLTVPILMLTALDSEEHVIEGLESGATAYVTKPVRPSEVRAWTRALLRSMEDAEARRFGDLELDVERRILQLRTTGDSIRLTPLQLRLVSVLMEAAGKVLSRETLLQRVWDQDFDPGTAVVEVHISHLRRKLAALGESYQIETIRNRGYRLKPHLLKTS